MKEEEIIVPYDIYRPGRQLMLEFGFKEKYEFKVFAKSKISNLSSRICVRLTDEELKKIEEKTNILIKNPLSKIRVESIYLMNDDLIKENLNFKIYLCFTSNIPLKNINNRDVIEDIEYHNFLTDRLEKYINKDFLPKIWGIIISGKRISKEEYKIRIKKISTFTYEL